MDALELQGEEEEQRRRETPGPDPSEEELTAWERTWAHLEAMRAAGFSREEILREMARLSREAKIK